MSEAKCDVDPVSMYQGVMSVIDGLGVHLNIQTLITIPSTQN